MKILGWLLVAAAIVAAVLAFNMDTSVYAPGVGYVNNDGLLSERQNYLIVAGVMAIAGVILLVADSLRSVRAATASVTDGTGKKCPACAEVVQRDARVCRHCGNDFSRELELEALGWLPDPIGRHQRRFRDGQEWTARVMDDDQESVDSVWQQEVEARLANEREAARLKEFRDLRKQLWGVRLGTASFWTGIVASSLFCALLVALFIDSAILESEALSPEAVTFGSLSLVMFASAVASVVLCASALVLGNRHWKAWAGTASMPASLALATAAVRVLG